jgi:hypothetical protein
VEYDADEAVPNLLPLSNRCNAEYDLVPGWINPTVAALASVTAVLALTALATTAVQRGAHARVE